MHRFDPPWCSIVELDGVIHFYEKNRKTSGGYTYHYTFDGITVTYSEQINGNCDVCIYQGFMVSTYRSDCFKRYIDGEWEDVEITGTAPIDAVHNPLSQYDDKIILIPRNISNYYVYEKNII